VQKKIKELIALMAVKGLCPAAIVEDDDCCLKKPGYTIPSAIHVMDVVRYKFTVAKVSWNPVCK